MANADSKLVNNAANTLVSVITNAQTTLQVGNAALFPTDGDFKILVGEETMLVTSVSGTTFTVTRGTEGTTAVAHSSGTIVKAITTEAVLRDYWRERWVHGNGTPNMSITNPVSQLRATTSDFTWVNQGTSTATDRNGNIVLNVQTNVSGDQFRGLFITAPSPPYAIIAAINICCETGGTLTTNAPFPQAELVFRESSTSKLFPITILPRADETDRTNVQVKTMTNATTFLANKVHTPWSFGRGPMWLKIEDDNTDLKFHVGINGLDWVQIFSETRTTHMAGGPNQVGFGFNQSGNNNNVALMELLHFGLEVL